MQPQVKRAALRNGAQVSGERILRRGTLLAKARRENRPQVSVREHVVGVGKLAKESHHTEQPLPRIVAAQVGRQQLSQLMGLGL